MGFLQGYKTIIGLTPLVVVFIAGLFGYDTTEEEVKQIVDLSFETWVQAFGAVMAWWGVVDAKLREIKARKEK